MVLVKILPGQYYDEETGLHYNHFRDYHPAIGRYIESDPLFLSHFILNNLISLSDFGSEQPINPTAIFIKQPRNLHLYNYTLNNPIRYVDQYGLYCGPGPLGIIPVLDYIWGINFSQSCSNHDDCYGNCDINKNDCDNNFLSSMGSVCSDMNTANKILCIIKSIGFYIAVQNKGDSFFNSAQDNCVGACAN